ncbi:hypothetical protein SAMN04487957_101526 [Halomonas shengliensis]|uniref:Uncharacterized protein n=1 Tax=Halomonas shengliensis TaxID=419597 RepID=A0A1H0DSN2_9GAMM|nr:hypothetical protein [Halomonas shengliensis]SDN73043.1 hypothetical protein SAMN04487957_101526 [Halomonas shengliensis]
MRAWYRAWVAGMLLALVAGCGGEAEDAPQDPPQQVALREPEPPSPPPLEVDPMGEAAAIDLVASLGGDRRLRVSGNSNLPEGARLQVIVERELSGVRWRERVSLAAGRFEAGPFGPGSGLPDGGYRVTAELQAASVQPREVQARIGAEGEHLSGPLVAASPHGLGQVVRASRRFLVGSEPRRASEQVEVLRVE